MCDYSLQNVASRPAQVGDTLITAAFNLLARGFCAIDERDVAVCLQPGTELVFENDIAYDHPLASLTFGIGLGKLRQRSARFRRINPDRPHTHHDALEFPDGKVVLVCRLGLGQRATVLQLPVSPPSTKKSANVIEEGRVNEPEKV